MNAKDIVAQNEKETRAGFGDGILEIARENKEVVVLTADLAGSFKLGANQGCRPIRRDGFPRGQTHPFV